jgi:hypothetical protein
MLESNVLDLLDEKKNYFILNRNRECRVRELAVAAEGVISQ